LSNRRQQRVDGGTRITDGDTAQPGGFMPAVRALTLSARLLR
jgi:hypothetical protein